VPVTYLARFNQMLVCNPSVGVKNLNELVALSKKQKLNYASGGAGVPGHMAMEMLLVSTQMEMTHVPYRGPAPATQDVLGGSVPCGFLATPVVGPFVRDGKLTALLVSGTRRTASLPNIPTAAEAGVTGYDASFFETMWAPRSTPPANIDRLQREIARILNSPEMTVRLGALDLAVVASKPAEAARQMRADHDKWGAVSDRIKLQLD